MSLETGSSRHLALLRRAGDVMTTCGTLIAALFIAMMSGMVNASPERQRAGWPAPEASGAAAGYASTLAAPVQLAEAVFVRQDMLGQDVLGQDAVVTDSTAVRGACGAGCAVPASISPHKAPERRLAAVEGG